MIRFFIMSNGKDSVKFDLPADELFDHLGSIGINEDIPITCSERIYLDFYPTDETDEIAKIVCNRLSDTDKISDVNALCHKLDGLWRISAEELENAFAENDVHGAVNMDKAYENLREELLGQSHELKM
ncbi:MAG: hypothetical protein OSJ43_09980 [Oscillospiraceae bacterium]|nr:hypothetical protein [Oscillospiraceae bacterium]